VHPEETVLYLKDYFSTFDIVNEALGKYETLATNATTVAFDIQELTPPTG